MPGIENILTSCISDVKADRHTLESCLASYPSLRGQLEPLLKIALSIKEPPAFKPNDEFRIRARVQLMAYMHDNGIKDKARHDILAYSLRGFWSRSWLKTATITVAIMLILLTITTVASSFHFFLCPKSFAAVKISLNNTSEL